MFLKRYFQTKHTLTHFGLYLVSHFYMMLPLNFMVCFFVHSKFYVCWMAVEIELLRGIVSVLTESYLPTWTSCLTQCVWNKSKLDLKICNNINNCNQCQIYKSHYLRHEHSF